MRDSVNHVEVRTWLWIVNLLRRDTLGKSVAGVRDISAQRVEEESYRPAE